MDRRRFCKIAALSLGAFGVSKLAKAGSIPDFTGQVPMPRDCRATVLRRECYIDLQAEHLDDPEAGPCPRFRPGESFTFSKGDSCPARFCPAMWSTIVSALAKHPCPAGDPLHPNRFVLSCPDGTRPLIVSLTF